MKFTEEHKKNLSIARKKGLKSGKIKPLSYWKGKKLSKQHKKNISNSLKGRIVSEHTKKKISKSNTGKTHSIETKSKLSKINKGKNIPNSIRKKISNSLKGKSRSFEVRKKISNSSKGKIFTDKTKKNMSNSKKKIFKDKSKHPRWEGGKTELSSLIRHSEKYIKWRNSIFKRDNYICTKCKKRGGYLNVHHIKHFSTLLKENNIKTFEEGMKCRKLWYKNNGITLCETCHYKIGHKRGKND